MGGVARHAVSCFHIKALRIDAAEENGERDGWEIGLTLPYGEAHEPGSVGVSPAPTAARTAALRRAVDNPPPRRMVAPGAANVRPRRRQEPIATLMNTLPETVL